MHPTDHDYDVKVKKVVESKAFKAGNISYGIVYMPPRQLDSGELKLAKQLTKEHSVIFECKI